ncbi:hypothetical protein [Prosthecobacter sp.]|uniref:hypothetical protein n=1 Tax=Prosthecobacter sp. TaxID=1965333 RepID=UPI002AB879FF|nr:hypothetical protein [Prosthecobacter sp.]MDZ4402336.1 hypothetical protein [Prosthecobacter sp.]
MNTHPTPAQTHPVASRPADGSSLLARVLGMPQKPPHFRQAAVTSHELVQKDHQKEIDRIAKASGDDLSGDYISYVMLPLAALVCVMIALRKVLAP